MINRPMTEEKAMHTIRSKDQYGNVWTAEYNGDFSGSVFIHKHDINSDHLDMVVDFCVIKELAATMILANKVSELEKQSIDQLLGFSR